MFERILVLSPHTDDGEMGCGGSVARFIREGKKVLHMVFTDGAPVGDCATLLRELENSSQILGINSGDVLVEKFAMRSFDKKRQTILDRMIDVREAYKPDLVFLPSSKDTHQDHATIFREGLRAFKNSSTIFGYEFPWNNFVFETSCFIKFEEEDLTKKIQALNCYESQKKRYYFSEEFILSLCSVRGTQIMARYAEAFELLRLIVR